MLVGKTSNQPFLRIDVGCLDRPLMYDFQSISLGRQNVPSCMLALDLYPDIYPGYEIYQFSFRKSMQSAILANEDGLSRQTLRFE